ncbi:MAG: response regulator transcription factor [Planctomycetes bacterium]|nr:response regulator transcription factor [Planctomycetota bacterium]
MKRLLIVEDEERIRETLADFFATQEFLVSTAASLAAARAVLARGDVAAIVLDLLLPDGDGTELVRELRGRGDATPILIASARGEERQRILGLRLGADDYLVKPFSLQELLARIEAVLRRTTTPAARLVIGDVIVDFEAFELRRGSTRTPLVAKEAELLRYLVQHPGRAFRREELLDAIWGRDAAPTTRTIDTHVFQLRQKLETDPAHPRHLRTVHGVGYRFDP